MRPRLTLAAALGLAVLAAPHAATGGTQPSISPGVVDIGADVLVSGLTDAGKRPVVTLMPVAGGRAWRTRAKTEGADTWLRVGAPSGEYAVTVATRSGPVAAGHVTVKPPRIVRLVPPARRSAKAEYVVTGANFGTKRGRVLVGGAAAKVGRWTNEEVRFRVKSLPGDVTDLAIETPTASVEAPCALLVCGEPGGESTVDAASDPSGEHTVWRLDWTPGQAGESSSHQTALWKWSTTVYDPKRQTLLFETEVDPRQAVGGLYLMVSRGGWVPETPDITAEIFFDVSGAEPRASVFAYKSREVGDQTNDGWTDDPSKPTDFIVGSLTDPGFLLASVDRTEPNGNRRLGFLIDVSKINAHKPMYGRTDGSAWTGLAFGDDENGQGSPAGHGANAGLWSYLYTNPNSTYDAEGRLTSWVVPKWGTYPGEDGPFFSAKPVPWSSIESPLIAIAAGAEASADGDELLTQDGTAFLVIRGNADRPDVLAGTADADAMRAGADDVLSAGTGDDVVLVDAASGGAVVDGGAGGTDVLRLMPDPVRVPAPSAPWGLALVLDPLPGGAPRVPHSMGDGTVDLGADASGRLEFPGGGSVRFRGVERIRY